ncbi:putative DNA-binding transcriptional regulator YafY [Paraburkholderia sp. GAS206C]
MRQIELVTLNMRELDRLKVVQAIVEMGLKPGRAAERLGLSVRQVERLVQRYQAAGVAGLVSGKRGRAGNHQLPDGMARRSLAIKPNPAANDALFAHQFPLDIRAM